MLSNKSGKCKKQPEKGRPLGSFIICFLFFIGIAVQIFYTETIIAVILVLLGVIIYLVDNNKNDVVLDIAKMFKLKITKSK